ncbi:hypothetical protein F5Y06DRAFT_304427 [Hypoxylon sp. FL0890]|nr:hypothetical protein F5Y06DRAFT_304427 [Hypoxylon sp. FL0890]
MAGLGHAGFGPLAGGPTRDEAVVCVVCGAPCKPSIPCALYDRRYMVDWMHPWLIKAKPGFLEWCRDPRSARAYRRCDDALLEVINVDNFVGGSAGFSNFNRGLMTIDTQDAEMYLPIHGPCAHLAEIFCRYQSRFDIDFRDTKKNGGEPSSITHLYEIWMKRALMSAMSTPNALLGLLRVPIDEPNGYFGAVYVNDLYEYAHFLKENPDAVQEANPQMDFMTTTRTVLKHLVPMKVDDMEPKPEFAELAARIKALPADIQRQIEHQMEPFDDLGRDQLVCTRVYPHTWWKKKVFLAELVPWIFDLTRPSSYWDLEKRVIHNDFFEDGMDWELLCRQLAQPDVFGPDGILKGCRSLENRYRIWRVLKSSRLGQMGARESNRPPR